MKKQRHVQKYFFLITTCILVVSFLLTGCSRGAVIEKEEVTTKVVISGTITYADYMGGEILYAAFTSKDYQTSTPIATGKISSPGTYSIQVPINSGQVWIVANNDVNGNGKPDPDEPHGELETPVTVSAINIEKVNITLMIGGAPTGEGASSFDVLPSLISAEFADDVAEEDKALVIQGISAADFCLQEWFGKSINRPAVLRVDASEAEPNAVLENGEMVILIGTNSKAFKKDGAHMAAHEYVHVYATYNGLGSTDVSVSITPLWFLEGEAEWLSYETMYEAGLSHPFEYEQTLTPLAKEETVPLKSLEKPTQTVVNSSRYALYALAIDYLMRDKPKKVLDDFAVNLADGKGMSMPQAFEKAFNITLDKFYEDFESYRKTW